MFKKLKRKKEDKKKRNDGSLIQDAGRTPLASSPSKENLNLPTAAMAAKSQSASPPPSPSSNANALPEQGVRAVALYDYQPEQEDEIALQGRCLINLYLCVVYM